MLALIKEQMIIQTRNNREKEHISVFEKRIKDLEFVTERQQQVISQYQTKLYAILLHFSKKQESNR